MPDLNNRMALTTQMKSTENDNQGMSRTKELNENNFIKKLKTLSKTNTDITVRSLKAPKIKSDL